MLLHVNNVILPVMCFNSVVGELKTVAEIIMEFMKPMFQDSFRRSNKKFYLN